MLSVDTCSYQSYAPCSTMFVFYSLTCLISLATCVWIMNNLAITVTLLFSCSFGISVFPKVITAMHILKLRIEIPWDEEPFAYFMKMLTSLMSSSFQICCCNCLFEASKKMFTSNCDDSAIHSCGMLKQSEKVGKSDQVFPPQAKQRKKWFLTANALG